MVAAEATVARIERQMAENFMLAIRVDKSGFLQEEKSLRDEDY